MITYEKLWATMHRKGISQYKLINTYGISKGQIDRLKKNEVVTTNTLDILCNILDCDVSEIITHTKDENGKMIL